MQFLSIHSQIHRILTNSPAEKDGRLKRGDRLLSINGLSMRGLTHRESLSVLKVKNKTIKLHIRLFVNFVFVQSRHVPMS